jgi:hypothetical protein
MVFLPSDSITLRKTERKRRQIEESFIFLCVSAPSLSLLCLWVFRSFQVYLSLSSVSSLLFSSLLFSSLLFSSLLSFRFYLFLSSYLISKYPTSCVLFRATPFFHHRLRGCNGKRAIKAHTESQANKQKRKEERSERERKKARRSEKKKTERRKEKSLSLSFFLSLFLLFSRLNSCFCDIYGCGSSLPFVFTVLWSAWR